MITVLIPSYGRAAQLKGLDYFSMASYVVPESQRDAYAKAVPANRLIPIPDAADGNIARKRNGILRNIRRPLVMVDDDVRGITYTEGGQHFKSFGHARQMVPLEKARVQWFLENGFNLAHQFDCKMWGINVNTDGRNYQQYKPFSLSQVILGPFQGHLEHDLIFDERMGTKDDYDMAIHQLKRYRKILRLNQFAYACEHGDNEGGIVGQRSMEIEAGYCRAIMAKWGRRIISYRLPPRKLGDLLNGRVNIPIRGV